MGYQGYERANGEWGVNRQVKTFHCKVASSSNVDLTTLNTGDMIDGVTVANGDIIFLPAQTYAWENGLWEVPYFQGEPRLVSWLRSGTQLVHGTEVCVQFGATLGGTRWQAVLHNDIGFGLFPMASNISWECLNRRPVKATTTTPYAVSAWEGHIAVDATAGAKTVTLPAPATYPGRVISVSKTDSSGNAVTVASAAGSVYGATSLASQYSAGTYVSDGTNWHTTAKN